VKLFQLVYVSDAKELMTEAAIESLLTSCRRHNAENNISGLLIYSSGHFIQLLEGDETILGSLFARISVDKRHHHVQLLHFGVSPERFFGTWRMGLLNLDTVARLDRSRLEPFATGITRLQSGVAILGLLREFRTQLPATDGPKDKAA
jgi:hypothetical protein